MKAKIGKIFCENVNAISGCLKAVIIVFFFLKAHGMKYNTLICIGMSILLAGCANGISSNGVSLGMGFGGMLGNHVGIGTSVNIPLGRSGSVVGDVTKTGINVIEEQIVTHFDANGTVSDAAVKGGFYRKLLSKPSSDEYLVQDFYEMGGVKRTDPMILSRDQLMIFRANPRNGTLTVYAINGSVMQNQVFKNNQIIK